jgi:hypothetical protein
MGQCLDPPNRLSSVPGRRAERVQAQISYSPPASPALARYLVRELPPDDVVDLNHFGRTRVDPNVLQDRHKALTEGIELRLRVPDLADSELPARVEGDVELESVR